MLFLLPHNFAIFLINVSKF